MLTHADVCRRMLAYADSEPHADAAVSVTLANSGGATSEVTTSKSDALLRLYEGSMKAL